MIVITVMTTEQREIAKREGNGDEITCGKEAQPTEVSS